MPPRLPVAQPTRPIKAPPREAEMHFNPRLLAFLVLLAPVVSVGVGEGPALDDPLPLQRKMVPLSRLPAELERVRQGVLVQMPRNEFEALVQRAARAGDPGQGLARLIKAKYSAELVDNSLVGKGQWT